MEKNELKIDFETLTEPAAAPAAKGRRGILPAAVTFAAAVLIFTSLTVHTLLLVKAAELCRREGGDMLLSLVLSDTVKKQPEREKEEIPRSAGKEEKTEEKKPLYINCDLSCNEENAMAVMNETDIVPDLASLFESEKPIPAKDEIYGEYGEGAPLFLIYHTHGTEAYAECADSGYRTTDCSLNVVAVGDVMAKRLENAGMGVVHLREMFDEGDFNTAYDRSTQAVREVLSENPSIQYVLDIHRDSVDRNGEMVKCAFDIGGEEYAQLMFVCGTDAGGSSHESWRENLTVSLQLQSLLWQKSGNLMRPVNLKEASFYQDTRAGALIVEFGASGNSLDEAKRSAKLFADVLTEYAER